MDTYFFVGVELTFEKQNMLQLLFTQTIIGTKR